MTKITCIGAGNLGAAIAYEIASRGIADELVLVDLLRDLAEGQAADILQALPYQNKTKVSSGDYPAMAHSDVIVLTAGKPRTPDIKDRLQLAHINIKIVGSILEEIKKYSPESIIITLTNPMDMINHFIFTRGFAKEKVIGSGGQLDSSRFRVVLGFPEKEVEAYVTQANKKSDLEQDSFQAKQDKIEKKVNELLKEIPAWSLKDWHLYKKFKFRNFKEAMKFVNSVADIAEQEGHHPDFCVHYNKVEVELWTHAIKGLSENDFILAAKIDEINLLKQ